MASDGAAAQLVLRSQRAVANGVCGVAARDVMGGEGGCARRVIAEGLLEAFGEGSMECHGPVRSDPLVEHFAVEVVIEREHRRDGVVGPHALSSWLDEAAAAAEVGQFRFDVLLGSLGGGGDFGGRKFAPSDTGCRQDLLLIGRETFEGVLDELADAVWDPRHQCLEFYGELCAVGAGGDQFVGEPGVEQPFDEQRDSPRSGV